jgi:hypothetical protein
MGTVQSVGFVCLSWELESVRVYWVPSWASSIGILKIHFNIVLSIVACRAVAMQRDREMGGCTRVVSGQRLGKDVPAATNLCAQ